MDRYYHSEQAQQKGGREGGRKGDVPKAKETPRAIISGLSPLLPSLPPSLPPSTMTSSVSSRWATFRPIATTSS